MPRDALENNTSNIETMHGQTLLFQCARLLRMKCLWPGCNVWSPWILDTKREPFLATLACSWRNVIEGANCQEQLQMIWDNWSWMLFWHVLRWFELVRGCCVGASPTCQTRTSFGIYPGNRFESQWIVTYRNNWTWWNASCAFLLPRCPAIVPVLLASASLVFLILAGGTEDGVL